MVELGILAILIILFLTFMLLPGRTRDERLERGKARGHGHVSGFASVCGSGLWVVGKIRSSRRFRR